jgi:hypothetical protein
MHFSGFPTGVRRGHGQLKLEHERSSRSRTAIFVSKRLVSRQNVEEDAEGSSRTAEVQAARFPVDDNNRWRSWRPAVKGEFIKALIGSLFRILGPGKKDTSGFRAKGFVPR